jgi:hypothetical protein
LMDENEEEFVFRSHVIAPSFHPKLFGWHLKNILNVYVT